MTSQLETRTTFQHSIYEPSPSGAVRDLAAPLGRVLVLTALLAGAAPASAAQSGTTGLRTRSDLRTSHGGAVVSWIEWNSDFLGTGLLIGDEIVAVDGVPLAELQRERPGQAPGGSFEGLMLANLALGEGDLLTVTARRGEAEFAVTARLVPGSVHDLGLSRPAGTREAFRFGEDGPPESLDDSALGSFGANTRFFYEQFHQRWAPCFLPYDLTAGALNSQLPFPLAESEAVAFEETRRSAEWLATAYPGRFTAFLRARVAELEEILGGELRPISEADLEWRRLGERRAAEVQAAGRSALDALLSNVGDALDDSPFPAPDPTSGALGERVGSIVLFDPCGDTGSVWFEVAEARLGEIDGEEIRVPRSWLAHGDGARGHYFTPRHTPAYAAFERAKSRYQRSVAPLESSRVQVLGRVTDEAQLIVDPREHAHFGVVVEPLAFVCTGGSDDRLHFLVDVRGVTSLDQEATFAGEAELRQLAAATPADDASPQVVVEAWITAVKHADYDAWHALFADWTVRERVAGTYLYDRVIDPSERQVRRMWEVSRNRLLDVGNPRRGGPSARVDDVRVRSVSAPRLVFEDAGHRLEETLVVLEYVALVDDEHRTCFAPGMKPLQRLQRRNGGPWRLVEIQPF